MNKNHKSYMDILNLAQKYRWPKKGDRLLRDSEDWDRGVEFANDEISRHVFIWSGYMGAGAALIDACEEHSHERHFLIYPILFNYRHGIELAMKWIIVQYGRYSTVKIGEIEHHDLWQLWELCKQIIIEVGSESESIAVIEQVIKDFHDLDKSALAFRYSRDKTGALIALPDGMIDLQNIRDVMEGVSHYFDGVDGQLDHNAGAVDWG
ncbi:MAG: hypothetical protein O7A66_00410 [Alphaproteobacteria bacterium]|nr:hypothetical protein [Alphaproteobacteria bacterium]